MKQSKQSLSVESEQQVQQSQATHHQSAINEAQRFVDNRPQTIAQRQLINTIHASPQMIAQRQQAVLSHNSPRMAEQRAFSRSLQSPSVQLQAASEEEILQGKFDPAQRIKEDELVQGKFETTQLAEAPAEKQNNTGLPDNLKSGIEHLSGMSMDDVKVHYNSSQPSQLNAHAYAQGSNIHVAPGQEQHLSHEAWHVVQQAQGRVKPTMQMKEGVPINDEAGLEHEADMMGAKAAQLMHAPSTPIPTPAAPVTPTTQRKILIEEEQKNENQVYSHLTNNDVAIRDAFISEIKSKPEKVQTMAEESGAYEADFGNESKDKRQIAEWNSEDQDYKYTNTKKDAEVIAKDTIKYYLYKKFKWLNIGVAAYMTGDVTGLLMATSLQDTVSLEILKGKKDKGEVASTWAPPENYKNAADTIFKTSSAEILGVPANELMVHVNEAMDKKKGKTVDTPNFYVKGDTEGTTKLPDTFKSKKLSGKLIETNVESDATSTGTRDSYKKKFDGYTDPKPKPWDKETFEATDMIGKMYPEKKQEMRDLLLPEKTEQETLNKIERYRNTKFSNKNIILMWGRLSGLGGGAHTELDSHPITMVQIAQKISADFPSRTIVLIGDKVVSESILRKAGVTSPVIDINTFWNDSYFKDNKIPMNDRRYQHYLVQEMSRKNDAVSIGMRSGSLEATALLGVKTIFLDDKGNNAEERMEFWAGDAANGRAAAMTSPDWQKTESEHEGPVENYKRVATSRKTGDKIHSGEIEKILKTLADMKIQFDAKNDDNAAVTAPQTQVRIGKFIAKIAGYDDIKKLAGDLALNYKDVINQASIKTGPQATENVKLLAATYESIKTKVEAKLKTIGAIGVGLTANELDQISGLTKYMISKVSNLESLAPGKMHERWNELSSKEKGAAREEVMGHKDKYPNVLRHIFHHKAPIGLGGYENR